jgi:hypothetical protein
VITEKPILFSAPMVKAILAGTKSQTRRIVNEDTLRVRLPAVVRSDNCGIEELDRVVKPVVARANTYRARLNPQGAVTLTDGRLEADLGVKPGEFHFVCPYAMGDTHLGNYGPDDQRWTVTPHESRLWVKETHALSLRDPADAENALTTEAHWWDQPVYAADKQSGEWERDGERIAPPWRPSIFMSRWASRITLDVTGVRIERLQDITEEDAKAEGVRPFFERFECIGQDQCLATGERAADAPYRAAYAVLWDEINGDTSNWKSNPWVWRIAFNRVQP